MVAHTDGIAILAVRCWLVSGHGTLCPYDAPLEVITTTKPTATTKLQQGRYVCFANSIYCLRQFDMLLKQLDMHLRCEREVTTMCNFNKLL